VANVEEFCCKVDLVPAAVWFVFGYLTIAGSTDVWGRLSGFHSGSVLSAPDVRSFFTFTVPLIRASFYSLGAYISSLVYSTVRVRVICPGRASDGRN
jgi:hypothetical protein